MGLHSVGATEFKPIVRFVVFDRPKLDSRPEKQSRSRRLTVPSRWQTFGAGSGLATSGPWGHRRKLGKARSSVEYIVLGRFVNFTASRRKGQWTAFQKRSEEVGCAAKRSVDFGLFGWIGRAATSKVLLPMVRLNRRRVDFFPAQQVATQVPSPSEAKAWGVREVPACRADACMRRRETSK